MLLLDANISPRVATILSGEFPGAKHVKDFSLHEASDSEIWQKAQVERLAIVSKDDDFLHRALLSGHPPKVILLRIGNCSTRELITFLRKRANLINSFLSDSPESLLILGH